MQPDYFSFYAGANIVRAGERLYENKQTKGNVR